MGLGNGSNTPNFATSPISTPPPEANRSGSGPSSVVGGVSNQPQKID